METLVTGASGFLGRHLVHRLLARGNQVKVLVRSAQRAHVLENLGVKLVVGDVTDRDALELALRGVQLVYHLAGKLFMPGVAQVEYYRTHVDGTRALLDVSRTSGSLRRFVHCSTTGVLGFTGDVPADEEAPPKPTNVYEDSKWTAELLVRKAIADGLPASIARPALVYGPGDLHLLGFFRSIQRGLFRPIGRKEALLHPIYVDDLIEGLIRCGEHPAATGQCFNIAGPAAVQIAGLAAIIAEALDKPLPKGHIPLAAARAMALVADVLPDRLKARAPLNRARVDFLTHSRVYDVTKAKTLLGFAAPTDLPTGIARTIAWYHQEGLITRPRATQAKVA